MEIFKHRIYLLEFKEQLAWLMTIVLMVAGIPILKAVLAFFVKLCEMLIQHGFGR